MGRAPTEIHKQVTDSFQKKCTLHKAHGCNVAFTVLSNGERENKTSKKHQYKVWPLVKHTQLQIDLSYCNFVTSLPGFNLHCVKYSLLQNILLGSGFCWFYSSSNSLSFTLSV